ncbi:fumarylacetoacetate hydrolase family protein [Micrococcales bacterium 31B]|nr:fumarylacetoacetate hydrolase family protein [Micrococcales bacterium 31B]
MRIARFTTPEGEPQFGLVETVGAGTATERTIINAVKGDPLYAPLQPTGERFDLDDVRLLAPVIPRSKVIGVGRNYAAHIKELGNETPDRPLLFFKPNTSVIGPGDPIVVPDWSENLHVEGELAVVIGRVCKEVPLERVSEVIFGYTVANDVTARDVQREEVQWGRAKGFDGSCPLGPWIETELDPRDVGLTTTLNGETIQDGRTSLMLYPVADLIVEISRFFTLLPGDVILTGTPAGVSRIDHGDAVNITVEGIGTLANPVLKR